ncbi:MAG: hypothetical protein WBM41_14500 [Arenicellales bacterium]
MSPGRLILLGVCMVTALVSATTSAVADAPVFPRGKGEQCVEPTQTMRKNHMKFLVHQRDDTVYQGVRTTKHSLKNCVDCHVQEDSAGQFIPIDAPGQFCQSCHEFASVKLDCFECHATMPDQGHANLGNTPGKMGSGAASLTAHAFSTKPSDDAAQ